MKFSTDRRGGGEATTERRITHVPVDLPEGNLGEIPLADRLGSGDHKGLRLKEVAAVVDECVRFSAILRLFAHQPAV